MLMKRSAPQPLIMKTPTGGTGGVRRVVLDWMVGVEGRKEGWMDGFQAGTYRRW
jgi:hypothetical protein